MVNLIILFFIVILLGVLWYTGDFGVNKKVMPEPENKKSEGKKVFTSNIDESFKAYSYVHTNGNTFYLHQKNIELFGGIIQTVFYFSKVVTDGACVLPKGKTVVENPKTGLPFLMDYPKSIEEVNEQILIEKNFIGESKDSLEYFEYGKSGLNKDEVEEEMKDKKLDILLAEIRIKKLNNILEDYRTEQEMKR